MAELAGIIRHDAVHEVVLDTKEPKSRPSIYTRMACGMVKPSKLWRAEW